MFNLGLILWLIPVLPLFGSIAATVLWFGPAELRRQAHWPCVLGAAGACVLGLCVLAGVAGQGEHDAVVYNYGTWFHAGNVNVAFSLRADGLTAIMLVMIAFIGSFIAIYSIGYMQGDPGYPRFFAAFSLFLFFMTGLVLANNFILLYACWEGVGLCSYLLIGYWYARPSAAAAARKAFLVTRLGDVGLFIGILVLWANFGQHSLEYDDIFRNAATVAQDALARVAGGNGQSGLILTACLLLFCGAAGKSAQFPLHVWLPDAMEGPTPVSALIHAATMVTAGVYLVARCTPLFVFAPTAQLVVAVLGATTALLAALIALTQTDLKRVLAYSTLSQLGYMFLGLGCGLRDEKLVVLAVFAGIFHLFTHAFFKALLFLAAGSVMHAMGDVIDMRKFGGLRRVLPVTHWTFFCGAAALAGVPILFSGFWSKDEIIAASYLAGRHSAIYNVLFAVGMITAALTAFYTGRAYFMTFWGEERIPPEAYLAHGAHGSADAHGHAAPAHVSPEPAVVAHGPGQVHESLPVMTVPLMVLAVGAVVVGIALGPTGLFEGFLEHHWMATFPEGVLPAGEPPHTSWLLMVLTSIFALGAIGLAYFMYVVQPAAADRAAQSAGSAYELSRNRFYIDELYDFFFVKPLDGLAYVLRILDQYLVDGVVDLVGQVPGFVGSIVRPIQNGVVQFYALLMALGAAGVLVAVLLRY